jgi:hypothetical protein
MDRWCAMFKGPLLIQNYRNGEDLKPFERSAVSDIVNVWRSKLASISWFMRCLNQPIAHQANLEDKCTGKFWESRFTSQALKSEEALLSGMAYVDLNPVRAEIADTPETSSYTSIQERLQPVFDLQQAIDDQADSGDLLDFATPLKPLLPFENRLLNEPQTGILFNFEEYLALVDWTGRIIRSDKHGYIDKGWQLPDPNRLFPVRTDHARHIIKRFLQLLDPVKEPCLASPRQQARPRRYHGHGAGC